MAINGLQIKGILFDLDGTLIDSVPDLTAALNTMLERQNLPQVSNELTATWVGNGMPMLVERALKHVGGDCSANAVEASYQLCNEEYSKISGQFSVFYPAVRMTLKTLSQAGYKLGMVTNKPSNLLPKIIT